MSMEPNIEDLRAEFERQGGPLWCCDLIEALEAENEQLAARNDGLHQAVLMGSKERELVQAKFQEQAQAQVARITELITENADCARRWTSEFEALREQVRELEADIVDSRIAWTEEMNTTARLRTELREQQELLAALAKSPHWYRYGDDVDVDGTRIPVAIEVRLGVSLWDRLVKDDQ